MDHVELRARIRALARDPETFARRSGLPVETVRQVLAGQVTNLPPLLRARLAKAVTPDERSGDETAG